jgi:hypothetical protein
MAFQGRHYCNFAKPDSGCSIDDDSDEVYSVCSTEMSYSNREPLYCVETRTRELHQRLGERALADGASEESVVTLVTPQPLDYYNPPSLAGSSVSTISTADSHLISLILRRLPRTRTAMQLYSGIGEKTRLCQYTPQSPQTDNGWGYFVDSQEEKSRQTPAATQRRRIFHR